MDTTVGDIARLVGGTVLGEADTRITGVNSIADAGPGELSFIRDARYLPYLETTGAAAVLIARAPENPATTLILVPTPDLAFAQVLQSLADTGQTRPAPGIHPSAAIADSARLGEAVFIDAHARIGENCVIGDRAMIYAGVFVGSGCVVGPDTVVHANVVLREQTVVGARCILHAGAILGSDGFGFAPLGGRWAKIPQVGTVELGDDVEIGSNTAIDRATFGVTRVGNGTKIDNLVQIGHNVRIGEHCVIAGKAGIAGSAVIGNHVRIGAGAGINGHIDIGDGATIGARAGVTKSVAPGSTVSGFPAMDHNLERRVLAAQHRLPDLLRRVRQLERAVQALEGRLHD